MRLQVDSGAVSRGGSEIADLATTLAGLVRQSERTVDSLASSTGNDDLQRELEELADALATRGHRVVRSLHAHGLQVRLAAETYEETDAELADRVPPPAVGPR